MVTVSVAERETICAECQGRGYSREVVDTVWDDDLGVTVPIFGLCFCPLGQTWLPVSPQPQGDGAAQTADVSS